MKLQRLELFGFKSFADRVTIEFNPGLTAIVGPNGCGKSNISDAIRWVLGEQRPTLVRGTRMDEVIFGGSRERKPINLAEVVLHFSNEDGLLPVEYTDVAIARRVFRDGESEYSLNRQACRLKDIQDLFFGTGIGAHAYSLIQQGMVDSILSDRTEERRMIFEEAAGVTRYKTRRKATERKLEATTFDLQRVEDIVGEVEKTVASLKRQVGKARRFLDYRSEETRLDVNVAAHELVVLEERRVPLAGELRALEAAETEQAARLAECEAGLESLELELIGARENEGAARAEADAVRRAIARREESRLIAGETLKHNAGRLEALIGQAEQARVRADDLAERRANLEVDHRLAAERIARIVERMAPETSAAIEEEHHAELRAERARLTAEVETLRERLAEVRQAAARQSTAAEGAAELAESLSAELEVWRRNEEQTRAEAGRARSDLRIRESQRVEAGEDVASRRALARTVAQRLEEFRERLAAERAAEQAAAGRSEALAAMEARFEGYARGAQVLLGGATPVEGIVGALPRVIEPREPRYEIALDRYLESLGYGVLVQDREAAIRGADRLAGSGGRRADFLIPEFVANGPPPEIPDAAAAVVLARGADAVRWTADAALAERFRPFFSRLLLVADRASGFRCRSALAESPEASRHYVIAGLDGTLLEPSGRWCTAGAAGDEGLLARRRRLIEAEAERDARGEVLAALRDRMADLERELEEAERALAEATAGAAAADDEHRAVREALVVAEESASQAARRVIELHARAAEATSAQARARAAGEAISAAELELDADLKRAAERQAAVRSALERLDEVKSERLSARHAIELERAEADADLRAVEREIEHLAAAEVGLDTAREARAAERVRLEEDGKGLEVEQAAMAVEIEALYRDLDGAEARLRASAETLRGIEERRTGYEGDLKTLRRRQEETTERRHQAALGRQDLDYRRETHLTHIVETYDAALESLLESHPLEKDEAVLELADLKTRLEEVRRKRLNLGPVNMLAVEEYEREAGRFEFMSRQRDDLVQAKRQLEEAIRRINVTARTLFEETFDQVRQNFNTTFQTLFEGGHAEVRLSDPDDPLESPIEIVASPRGKRVQSINLLSGGERALTALSLLFAIYRVKPSPFCILDEVDAPLDDANIGRFLAMIRHFSTETQFIVVTHNRRTMEAADYLYGVTMEEPGVSSLVSVSLTGEDAEGEMEDELTEGALAAVV